MTEIRGIVRPTIVVAAVLAALLLIVGARDASAAITFAPFGTACLDNAGTADECDGSADAGDTPDITVHFGVDAPDSNFGGVITFIPGEWGVAKGADVPDGAIVGRLSAKATLGLLNQPCKSTIFASFTLMDASVNINDTIDPLDPGETNVFTPLAKDANNNGIPDGVDKYPSFLNEIFTIGSNPPLQPISRAMGISLIEGNWIPLQFLVFAPGTRVSDVLPASAFQTSRGYPSVTVLGNSKAPAEQSPISDFCSPLDSVNISFGQTRDNPCTPVVSDPNTANCPQQQNKASFYPQVGCDNAINDDASDDSKTNDGCPQVNSISETGAQCDNATSDDGEDTAVNDGCAQVGDTSEAGVIPDADGCDQDTNEASCARLANPDTAGKYTFLVLAASQRDADGDGHENSLDTCALDAEPNADYRNADTTYDADLDGLTSACDPNPNSPSTVSSQTCPSGNTGADEDADCFSNRQDNCPLDQNDQTDTDLDGFGDTCDPNPSNRDTEGDYILKELTTEATIAPAGTGSTGGLNGGTNGGTNGGGTDGTGDGTGTGGAEGGPAGGVGALAPAVSSIPAWATVASGLGGAGLLGSIGAFAARFLRIRRREDDE
jgi:hypothetical protein